MEKDKQDVSYLFYESEMSRAERKIRRLWITILALLGCTTVTNILWILRCVK